MLECLHVDLQNWLCNYAAELSMNRVLKVLVEHLGWLNMVEVTFGTVLWGGSSELSVYMCNMADHVLKLALCVLI